MDSQTTPSEEPRFTNRLINESSPYLRQHAHNPVDWYPWGEEAFKKARETNRPIFLSVGYSTCHWCHVMEKESFENPEIAKIMNEHFINIKVDREERPDVDRLYMTFVQAVTGSGGWPMSVFLTPELTPIFGGTYFPPRDRYGTPGFASLLLRVSHLWDTRREALLQQGKTIIEQLRSLTEALGGGRSPSNSSVRFDVGEVYPRTLSELESEFDRQHGGFGEAPKFPRPSVLNFLEAAGHWAFQTAARLGREGKDKAAPKWHDMARRAVTMATATLTAMGRGGLYDHLGGGFHRYSVDEWWHVPHYEKMLYDQAQLLVAYSQAGLAAPDPLFAAVVRETVGYLVRDMQAPEGGFYSAEDADSLPIPQDREKREGAFYLWRHAEVAGVLSGHPQELALFTASYGVEPQGNIRPRSDPHGELRGYNHLYRKLSLPELLKTPVAAGMPADEVEAALGRAKALLFEHRSRRPRPHLDDKVLTAWNGLALSGLAAAYLAFADPSALAAAERAAAFVRQHLYDSGSGTLRRSWRRGTTSPVHGFLADYAFLIGGLLDLYEASADAHWLEWALALQRKQDALFWDPAAGGYFDDSGQDPAVLIRMKGDQDMAEPAPASLAASNLLRLAAVLMDGQEAGNFRERAAATAATFAEMIRKMPTAVPQMLVALEPLSDTARVPHIIIVGPKDDPATVALREVVFRGAGFIPYRTIVHLTPESAPFFASLNDFYSNLTQTDRPMMHVCINGTCRLPTGDPEAARSMLEELAFRTPAGS